jgi:hypothetical protein
MTNLPKEAFLALAAMGWADGRMTKIEREGLARAAASFGLSKEDQAAVAAALEKESSLEHFVAGGMSPFQCAITYAIACWFARLDGVVSTEEHASLATLRKGLDLEAKVAERASIAAFEVSVLPEGGKPDRFDFAKLIERLEARLPGLAKE